MLKSFLQPASTNRPLLKDFLSSSETLSVITFESLFQTANDLHYRFNDSETLFQLSDGTGAVFEDGDPIGYITDLSVNGNHATQIELTMRSLLGTRYDATILSPDWQDDNYQWDVGGVAGTFWFSSQFGAQVFLMYSLDNMPMGQYYECGFFGRELSLAEQVVLLAYAESTIPVAALSVDGEIISEDYAAGDNGLGLVTQGFRFTSNNFFLSAEPPYNDIPYVGVNATSQVLNDTYVFEYPAPATVEAFFIDLSGDIAYMSTGIYKAASLAQFTGVQEFLSTSYHFGNSAAFSAFTPTSVSLNQAGYGITGYEGYGLCGYLPDFTHVTGLTKYSVVSHNFSGNIPDHAKPAAMPALEEYFLAGLPIIGDAPSIASMGTGSPYVVVNCPGITGYAGGGINPALTTFAGFSISDSALTQEAVDLVLSDFEATIGTINPITSTIYLSGGTNAPPSAAGLISKANLITAGWTVVTN